MGNNVKSRLHLHKKERPGREDTPSETASNAQAHTGSASTSGTGPTRGEVNAKNTASATTTTRGVDTAQTTTAGGRART